MWSSNLLVRNTPKETLITKKNCSIPFKIYLNHDNLFSKIKCVVGDEMEIIQRGQWVFHFVYDM
jgi:hypothetical protein